MQKQEDIQDVLTRRLAHHGLLGSYVASKVCDAAKKVAKGEFEPISFAKGVLKVGVNSSGKGHKIKLLEQQLIVEINQALGSRGVKRLVVVVKE